VYTVANESKHILIFGVPDLKLRTELKNTLAKYGRVEKLVELQEYPGIEEFTKVYHATYEDIRNARLNRIDLSRFIFNYLFSYNK
jgi:RNA-binding protein 48